MMRANAGAVAKVRDWLSNCVYGAVLIVVVATPASSAENLPLALTAATRLIPSQITTQENHINRRQCLSITGLADNLPSPMLFGDHVVFVHETDAYRPSSEAAYLGNASRGAPASSFVEVLLAAGVATRVPVTFFYHTHTPNLMPLRLLDTAAPKHSSSNPGPSFTDREKIADADIFLVSGPDRVFFGTDSVPGVFPQVPKIDQPEQPVEHRYSRPVGIFAANAICYTLVPDRMLEYHDAEKAENGVRSVSAVLLLHPIELPGWIKNPHITENLTQPMMQNVVRTMSFRNDGDGWRVSQDPFPMTSSLQRISWICNNIADHGQT